MDKLDKSGTLPEVAAKLGIGSYHRHVVLCAGDKCCTAEVGAAAWDALKRELKDRGLSLSAGPNACYRTKAACLRICQGGPIAVVYPEGTWYAGLTAERIPLFVQHHLVEGRPVGEWVFARNPLPNPAGEAVTETAPG
jgi:(2Fe-2S) ferredoxin